MGRDDRRTSSQSFSHNHTKVLAVGWEQEKVGGAVGFKFGIPIQWSFNLKCRPRGPVPLCVSVKLDVVLGSRAYDPKFPTTRSKFRPSVDR